MWCIVYWYYCLVNLAQIQPYQPSTSNLTNWSKMDVCLCGDVTVAIDPVNGNQGYDLAAWHCKSVIDRLELIHAVISKGFSYWCLSMSALKTLTSGVKVRSWFTPKLHNHKPETSSVFPGWELRVHTVSAVLLLLVRKKKTWLGCQASQHYELDRFEFSGNAKPPCNL